MTMLERTDLTTPNKVQLAACAIAHQGKYGAIGNLAADFGVSRPTVYDVRKRAWAALSAEADRQGTAGAVVSVPVDRRQLERAVVALRVVAPNSVRSIEDLLPILYPGIGPSYGAVQSIAAEAEKRACEWNQASDLRGIDAAAVDEMFSQGDPVLAGVDLDSGALFALSQRDSRSGDEWASLLSTCREQGLCLKVAVKDAAKGIRAGITRVFPNAEQRDDCFHALYEMGKVQRILESRAYGAIRCVEAAEQAIEQLRCAIRPRCKRIELVSKLNVAQYRCRKALTLHDRFEAAQRRVQEALEFVDLDTATIRCASWIQDEIERAACEMLALHSPRCHKVGRYIKNRAPGLSLYAAEIKSQLDELSLHNGDSVVRLCCVVWRLMDDLALGRRRYQRRENQQLLAAAFSLLEKYASDDSRIILSEVNAILRRRHRASSAIEGFNAALRPFLYVHKGVTQGFLELFRARYNLRVRRWGRHKGTTAHEVLTGERVGDWLTVLGYPPSVALD